VLATLALWAVFHHAAASAWWAELLRFLPYPAYLAPALLAMVASWWLRWPWRAAALASVVCVLLGVMDFRWGSPDPGTGSFRLMTWNAKAYRHTASPERDHRIALELLEHDADVIVLQDADDYARPGATLPEPVALALRGRTIYTHDEYVVASRLPLSDCRPHPMPVTDGMRYFVHCTLRVGAIDVDLVTAHLLSPRAGLNAARHEWFDGGLSDWQQNYRDRLRQVDALMRHLAGTQRPLILAGDLNAVEASPVVRALEGLGLRDAFARAGRGFGYTHGHSLRPRFSFLRIDHVLVNPRIGVANCQVGGRDASEHRPVIADLRFSPG
jgi:endonuclease/exonuclease/phosphatase family metal-dependent hydrolase